MCTDFFFFSLVPEQYSVAISYMSLYFIKNYKYSGGNLKIQRLYSLTILASQHCMEGIIILIGKMIARFNWFLQYVAYGQFMIWTQMSSQNAQQPYHSGHTEQGNLHKTNR